MYDTFWGYLKKSFKLIFENPVLFIPIIISLILTVASILGIVAGVGAGVIGFPRASTIPLIILGTLILIILELFIVSGIHYMINQVVTVGTTSMDDFWSGAKKYAGRIFLGSLMILGVVILGFVLLIVPAIFSRSFGLMILMLILFGIPAIVFGILISFWQAILVYEDCDVIEAFKLSYSFAKKHFGLVFIINLLEAIFTGNRNSSRGDNNGTSIKLPISQRSTTNLGRFFNTNLPLSYGAISGVALIIVIIKSFLELFFNVMYFVVYHDRRKSIFDNVILED